MYKISVNVVLFGWHNTEIYRKRNSGIEKIRNILVDNPFFSSQFHIFRWHSVFLRSCLVCQQLQARIEKKKEEEQENPNAIMSFGKLFLFRSYSFRSVHSTPICTTHTHTHTQPSQSINKNKNAKQTISIISFWTFRF